ncbi:MAG: serine hydrolase [Patescibacteria group bacterium]
MKRKLFLIVAIFALIISLFFIVPEKNRRFFSATPKNKGGILKEEGGSEEYLNLENVSRFCPACGLLPTRKPELSPPHLGETAGIAILFNEDGKTNILYEKNIDQRLPIASLTKLMTAMIVIDKYPLDKTVEVSQGAVWTEGESGRLSAGERTSVLNLLRLTLLVSSNDAASVLAEIIGTKSFVDLMNEKTKEIGLENTHFTNVHGLDDKENFSSVEDLALLTQYSLLYYPEIWEILQVKEIDVFSQDFLGRKILHHLRNTNKLIYQEDVLGGKTGYTEEAKETMILATKAPQKTLGNIIIVLLGVDDRIKRAEELYGWTKGAYYWN